MLFGRMSRAVDQSLWKRSKRNHRQSKVSPTCEGRTDAAVSKQHHTCPSAARRLENVDFRHFSRNGGEEDTFQSYVGTGSRCRGAPL
jgi:hypothetical protein